MITLSISFNIEIIQDNVHAYHFSKTGKKHPIPSDYRYYTPYCECPEGACSIYLSCLLSK